MTASSPRAGAQFRGARLPAVFRAGLAAWALGVCAAGCASGDAFGRAGAAPPPRAECVDAAGDAAAPARALADGRAQLDADRAEAALCFFEAAARAAPQLADHAARWQAEALLHLQRPRAALLRARAATSGASPHAARALWRVMARAHEKIGAHADAREAYLRAGQGEPDTQLRAELLRARALSHEAQGAYAAARAPWFLLWRDHGETRAAIGAGAALDRLHALGAAAPHRSAEAQGARCFALARARSNEEALARCDAALALLREADAVARGDAAARSEETARGEATSREAAGARNGAAIRNEATARDDATARGEGAAIGSESTAGSATLRDGAAGTRERAGLWRKLARQRADLLFRLRRYAEAVRAYAALAPSPAANFWRARSLARSGEVERAMALFERVARARDERGVRAQFLLATLLEERDTGRAAAHYEAVVTRTRDAEQRRTALWRLGWNAYRAQQFTRAARYFERLASDDPDAPEVLRGRYWAARARAQVATGAALAERTFAALAAEYPFSYHGLRAGERAPRAELASARARTHKQRAAAPPAKPRAQPSLPPRTLERARILIDAGFGEDAAAELAPLRKKIRGDANRQALAAFLHDAGDYHAAGRLVLDAYQAKLQRGPAATGDAASARLWQFAWPLAFEAEVAAATSQAAVPRALLYAVMREESHYRPRVVSVVGARGLAQIMPATGRVLAGRRARTFDPEELFEPARNLELAARYLEKLLARFGGRASAAVAAYNAGPEAVEAWLARAPALPEDVWVEAIPYPQTRGYVKRVLRSAQAYRLLYEGEGAPTAGPASE